jgi:hypothetical protein
VETSLVSGHPWEGGSAAGGARRAASHAGAAGLRAIVCPARPRRYQRRSATPTNTMIAACVPYATRHVVPRTQTAIMLTDVALHQLDHAVVEAVPAVHHAGQSGAGVGEQVEVVAYELHLVERIVDCHGGGGVPLAADDAARSLPIR